MPANGAETITLEQLAGRLTRYAHDLDLLAAASGLQPELVRQVVDGEIVRVEPWILERLAAGLQVEPAAARRALLERRR
jgi:hypothetical protein